MFGQGLERRLRAECENPAVIDWADRETMLVMDHVQQPLLLVELQWDFAVLECHAIVTAKERQQQLPGQ